MNFGQHAGGVLLRGTVAAVGSALPLLLPVALVAYIVNVGGMVLLLGLFLGCLLAGPLAAYSSAALGERPRIRDALRLGVHRIWRLTPIVYLFLALPLLVFPSAGEYFAYRLHILKGDRDYPAEFLALLGLSPLYLWLFARYFVLAAVCVVLEEDTIQGAFRRARELGRGHLPTLLTAALLPMVVFVAGSLVLMPEAGSPPVLYHAALGGCVLSLFLLGPALAAAAYAVALPPLGPPAGNSEGA